MAHIVIKLLFKVWRNGKYEEFTDNDLHVFNMILSNHDVISRVIATEEKIDIFM